MTNEPDQMRADFEAYWKEKCISAWMYNPHPSWPFHNTRGNMPRDFADNWGAALKPSAFEAWQAASHQKQQAWAGDVLTKAWYHYRPADEDCPEDYDIYSTEKQPCPDCIPVLIVRATATPQPEPKALEPVAWLDLGRLAISKMACITKPRVSELQSALYTAAQLNQARIEVAERCIQLCQEFCVIYSNKDREAHDHNYATGAAMISQQIKQLADQMRGGE
jgi:hypothetical protein